MWWRQAALRAAQSGLYGALFAANGFTVATRDTSPFEAAGLNVINPWEAAQW